ncbi:LysE family transporter [Streptomyces silvensis]|uniref:Lysine transporter LysE n=1 Tax=Streptomyces silvensis TaxID=1765722 RepID=A0A0W7X568_9ACTN|nr:LysE family transporter [Streptomyces silvensis]KUF17972.1 lysine transporter LysE [Streptomyces silvensis]
MTGHLVAGLLAGYGIAVPVGAVAAHLVALTARTSLRTGVSAALGVATADGLYALLAVVAGTTAAAAVTPFVGPLRWVSACVLVALAAHSAAKAFARYRGAGAESGSPPDVGVQVSPDVGVQVPPDIGVQVPPDPGAGVTPDPGAEATPDAPSPARAYVSLLGITLLNPTTVIYFAALVVGSRTDVRPDLLGQAVFTLAAFAASAGWQLLLAGGGALLGRALTGRRGRLGTALVSGALTVGLAVHMVTSAG